MLNLELTLTKSAEEQRSRLNSVKTVIIRVKKNIFTTMNRMKLRRR